MANSGSKFIFVGHNPQCSKTRNVGFAFLILGAGLAYYVTSMAYDSVIFINSILAFIGGMLGGIIGIVIFLVAIIKS